MRFVESNTKALEILETRERYQGQMRREIAKILTKTEGLEESQQHAERLSRHRALRDLAEIRAMADRKVKGYRLVTTNFDNRFQLAGLDLALNEDGPRLWSPSHEGASPLVHLHGRIGNHDPEHRHLILTTRDFGNADLRHGWAARFVEMFREFTVLFIGYSLSDPVMRYLMDVFATESGKRRQFRSAYALSRMTVASPTIESSGKRSGRQSGSRPYGTTHATTRTDHIACLTTRSSHGQPSSD